MLSSLPMTMTSRLQISPTDMDDLLFRMHYQREVSIAQHTVLGLAARSSIMTRPRQCERGHQGTYASTPALPHLAAPVVAAGRRIRVLLQHTWSAAVGPRRGRLRGGGARGGAARRGRRARARRRAAGRRAG